jgi:hydrogenase maturation protease
MHQAGFQEVLASADLTGSLPAELALVGVQPEMLNDYGGSLTDAVRDRIDEAVEVACQVLREWDIEPLPREKPLSGSEQIGPVALDMREYELGRPVVEGGTP